MKSLSEKDTRRPALTRAAAPSCGEARIRGSQGCHRLLSPCVAASVIGHGVLRRPENLDSLVRGVREEDIKRTHTANTR